MAKPIQTDDDIRNELQGVLTQLGTLATRVQALTDALDARAKSQQPAPNAALPAALAESPPSQPSVVEQRPKEKYGFMFPGLSGAFNTANAIIEGKALPNYIIQDAGPNYANFRAVLIALAAPELGKSNREAIYPVELDQFLADNNAGEDVKAPMSAIKGNAKDGWNIVVLRAGNDANEPIDLYVLEDKLRQKLLVAGPAPVDDAFAGRLSKDGVTYVQKESPTAVKQINEFLAEGAKYRGDRGMLIQTPLNYSIENLIKAMSALCEFTPGQEVISNEYSVGDAIRSAKNPACFTNVTRPSKL